MTGEQLKKSILQYAIEGKLVPQDEKEEPASVLIERIREEKERLIKEKKIKRDKNESFIYRKDGSFYERIGKDEKCIDDELPFDIPDNWEWTRLESMIILQSGQDLTANLYSENIAKYPYITGASNIDFDNVIINRWTNFGKNFAYEGDILITCKGTIGKLAILNLKKVHIARQIMAIRVFKGVLNLYVKNYLKIQIENLKNKAQSMIPGISRDVILRLLIPIPPLAEQERIIEKIEELLPMVEKYGKAKEELNNLNAVMPENLKKSILQYAIEGKLVPQDEKEEPASVLIERIREEKERLIKEKKIKRDKNESFIYRKDGSFYERIGKEEKCIDDELPFDIPNNWEWARFGSISNIYTGNSVNATIKEKKYMNIEIGYNYIGTKDVGFDSKINYENGVKIPYDEGFKIAPQGSVLMCIEGGSAGKKIAYLREDVCFGNKLACFNNLVLSNLYINYYLMSPILKKLFENSKTGIIGGVSINVLKQILIPIPPLAEQERIIEKIEELLPMVERLKN